MEIEELSGTVSFEVEGLGLFLSLVLVAGPELTDIPPLRAGQRGDLHADGFLARHLAVEVLMISSALCLQYAY